MEQWITNNMILYPATALNGARDTVTTNKQNADRLARRTGRDAVHATDMAVDLHQLAQRQGTLLLRQDGAAGEIATARRQISQHPRVRHPLWDPARRRARWVDPLSEEGRLAALRRPG